MTQFFAGVDGCKGNSNSNGNGNGDSNRNSSGNSCGNGNSNRRFLRQAQDRLFDCAVRKVRELRFECAQGQDATFYMVIWVTSPKCGDSSLRSE
jgi:hypothetical protein